MGRPVPAHRRRARLPWFVSAPSAVTGMWALYLVNHGGRESIEMYGLKPAAEGGPSSGTAVWWESTIQRCRHPPRSDGFLGTYSTAAGGPGKFRIGVQRRRCDRLRGALDPRQRGVRSQGNALPLPEWSGGHSPDGRYMYMNAFTAREVHKFDLRKRIARSVR